MDATIFLPELEWSGRVDGGEKRPWLVMIEIEAYHMGAGAFGLSICFFLLGLRWVGVLGCPLRMKAGTVL